MMATGISGAVKKLRNLPHENRYLLLPGEVQRRDAMNRPAEERDHRQAACQEYHRIHPVLADQPAQPVARHQDPVEEPAPVLVRGGAARNGRLGGLDGLGGDALLAEIVAILLESAEDIPVAHCRHGVGQAALLPIREGFEDALAPDRPHGVGELDLQLRNLQLGDLLVVFEPPFGLALGVLGLDGGDVLACPDPGRLEDLFDARGLVPEQILRLRKQIVIIVALLDGLDAARRGLDTLVQFRGLLGEGVLKVSRRQFEPVIVQGVLLLLGAAHEVGRGVQPGIFPGPLLIIEAPGGHRRVIADFIRVDVLVPLVPKPVHHPAEAKDQDDGRQRQHQLTGMDRHPEALEYVRETEDFRPVDPPEFVLLFRHGLVLSMRPAAPARASPKIPFRFDHA